MATTMTFHILVVTTLSALSYQILIMCASNVALQPFILTWSSPRVSTKF